MIIATEEKNPKHKWQCFEKNYLLQGCRYWESKGLYGLLLVQYCRKSCKVVQRERGFCIKQNRFFSFSFLHTFSFIRVFVSSAIHVCLVWAGSDMSKRLACLFLGFWIVLDAKAWMWLFHPKKSDSNCNFFFNHPVPPSRIIRKCHWFIHCLFFFFSSLAAVCLWLFFLVFLVFFY